MEYDPTRDDDTKYLSIANTGSSVIVLPDGSQPVPLGSGIITGILGEGGMAIVYEIWNKQLGVKRAVKLLRPNSSQENRERFDIEIKLTAQLDHHNIIKIHSVGEWNGLPYIEMERIDGVSLSELIKEQGALPLEVCVSIAIIICRALNYTHNHEYNIDDKWCKGIMHRDLKPGNILISNSGVIKLSDFGIATPTNVAASTSSGKVIGSMQYLAPEQLEEEEIDIRADIFSFGCIVYEMLTGERAFPDRNITRLIRKRLRNIYKPLSSFDISIPNRLTYIINNCLQLQVNKRPKSIKDVLHFLNKIHSSITSHSPENIITAFIRGYSLEDVAPPTQYKFPLRKVAGVVLILLSIAAAGLYVLNYRLSKEMSSPMVLLKPDKPAKRSLEDIPESELAITRNKKIETKSNNPTIKVDENNKEDIQESKSVDKIEKVASPKTSTAEAPRSNRTSTTKRKKIPIKKISRKTEEQIQPQVVEDENENEVKSDSTTTKKVIALSLDQLRQQAQYKNLGPVEIMVKEDAQRQYENVLAIYKSLHPSQANLKEAKLLKHRAVVATNQVDKSYFDNTHINDGEFYLSKAQFLYESKQYQRAIWILGIIKTSPTEMVNKKTLNKKVLYYTAKCNTALFNNTPSPEKQKLAMRSWFSVKNEFRTNQNHPYFAEANREIRNISKRGLN